MEVTMRMIYLIAALLVCSGNILGQVNLDSGLVAYYPFNGNANDESSNNNHGTEMGAILTSDRFGNDSAAYEFNGTSSYISIPNSPTLQSPSTELTQVAWIHIYSWSLVGIQVAPILMKSNSGSNSLAKLRTEPPGSSFPKKFALGKLWTLLPCISIKNSEVPPDAMTIGLVLINIVYPSRAPSSYTWTP